MMLPPTSKKGNRHLSALLSLSATSRRGSQPSLGIVFCPFCGLEGAALVLRPHPSPASTQARGLAYEPAVCLGPGPSSLSKSPTRNQECGRYSATLQKGKPLPRVRIIFLGPMSPLASASVWAEGRS